MPTSRRHYRVTLGNALSAHEIALKTGGRAGVHDLSLVESAIDRPYSGYYRPIHKKAAALLQSVATNHGFHDGNKRTAFILVNLLLERSGCAVHKTSTRPHEDDIEHLILDMTLHFLDLEEVTNWFKKRIYRV